MPRELFHARLSKSSVSRYNNNPDTRAFTLVELLTVLAVIGVLAALLFPVLSRAKARAGRALCVNNLKQVNAAVRMYCDDHGDTLPDTNFVALDYKPLVQGYLGLSGRAWTNGGVFWCPASEQSMMISPLPPFAIMPRGRFKMEYHLYRFNGGNADSHSRPGIAGLKLCSLRSPSKTVTVAEASAFIGQAWHDHKYFDYELGKHVWNMAGFGDGHVAYTRFHRPSGRLPCAADPPSGYDYQWSGR